MTRIEDVANRNLAGGWDDLECNARLRLDRAIVRRMLRLREGEKGETPLGQR
jgi:hypothetical protein